jgi:hypothetical protein
VLPTTRFVKNVEKGKIITSFDTFKGLFCTFASKIRVYQLSDNKI